MFKVIVVLWLVFLTVFSMSDYTTQGYSSFLSKDVPPVSELDPLQVNQNIPELSGSTTQGGVLQSNNAQTILNLEDGYFAILNGQKEIIRFGNQQDKTIGIEAKDEQGNTTLGVDASGNATFSGQIKGGTINVNDNFTVDKDGNIVAKSIALANVNSTTNGGPNQRITSLTPVLISGTEITINLKKNTILLVLADVRHYSLQNSGSGDWDAQSVIAFAIDGEQKNGAIRTQGGLIGGGVSGYGDSVLTSSSMHRVEILPAGNHVISLKGYLSSSTNNGAMTIYSYKVSVVTLGTSL